MKIKKKIFIICYIAFLPILNGCVQSTVSLFGPAIAGAKTGNIYQAGFSYASNSVIKRELGQSPGEYVQNLLINNSNKSEASFAINSFPINKIEKPKNIKISTNSENNNNDYNEFLSSVKKMLK